MFLHRLLPFIALFVALISVCAHADFYPHDVHEMKLTRAGARACAKILTVDVLRPGALPDFGAQVLADHLIEINHPMRRVFETLNTFANSDSVSALPEFSRRRFIREHIQDIFEKHGTRGWIPRLAREFSESAFFKSNGVLDGFSFTSEWQFTLFVEAGGDVLYRELGLSRLQIGFENFAMNGLIDVKFISAFKKVSPFVKYFALRGLMGEEFTSVIWSKLFDLNMPLESLRISNFTIPDTIIAKLSKNYPSLKSLVLDDSELSGSGLLKLAHSVFSLKHLSLRGTVLTGDTNPFEMLFNSKHKFTALDLTPSEFSSYIVGHNGNTISALIKNQTELRSLKLNWADENQVIPIANSQLPIRELVLEDYEGDGVFAALANGPLPLEVIDISIRSFGNISFENIAHFALSKKKISKLFITSDSDIYPYPRRFLKAVRQLLESFGSRPELVDLFLRWPNHRHVAFKKNPGLTHIKVK